MCVAAEFDGVSSNKSFSKQYEIRRVVSGDEKLLVSAIINRFKSMKEELFNMLTSKKGEVEELCEELCVMKKKFPLLEGTINDANASERMDTIIFSGSVESIVSTGEN